MPVIYEHVGVYTSNLLVMPGSMPVIYESMPALPLILNIIELYFFFHSKAGYPGRIERRTAGVCMCQPETRSVSVCHLPSGVSEQKGGRIFEGRVNI